MAWFAAGWGGITRRRVAQNRPRRIFIASAAKSDGNDTFLLRPEFERCLAETAHPLSCACLVAHLGRRLLVGVQGDDLRIR
jgi:hypothetical protein